MLPRLGLHWRTTFSPLRVAAAADGELLHLAAHSPKVALVRLDSLVVEEALAVALELLVVQLELVFGGRAFHSSHPFLKLLDRFGLLVG